SNGCTADTSVSLQGYPRISLDSLIITPPSCYGSANGRINLNTKGGVSPLSYQLSQPARTNKSGIFDSLRRGSYIFRITDAKGCRKDTVLALSEPEVLRVSSAATTIDCEGGRNGGEISTA